MTHSRSLILLISCCSTKFKEELPSVPWKEEAAPCWQKKFQARCFSIEYTEPVGYIADYFGFNAFVNTLYLEPLHEDLYPNAIDLGRIGYMEIAKTIGVRPQ